MPVMTDAERTAASAIFGDRVGLAERFVLHLATSGIERGLLGPREVPRLWSRHVLNCAVVSELIGQQVSVCDVGSGAGLPGIALAIARPDLSLELVEPLERRVTWLDEVVRDLGLKNVVVRRARAEQVVDDVDVDVVTARAVSALGGLMQLTIPLLHGHGEVLAIKGRSASEEVAKAGRAIRKLGGSAAEIITVGAGILEEPTTVVRVRVG
ncbi:16S rRNA (guanine(527)-N(7))-methyltransferase RsmG [Arthrobacter sp. Br18]|uniref:16S rRNA (guanine(527)-N(7))-methyltransferase RsmG n=1 Tax=Arthrobacter sp. Br18 TaxID=1312954 RepID=UPI0012DC46DB|nr:16S rRNA (guanine(527)-N(7))-methyltransferase RsmG [Arthrobacter sp. Br18]